MYTQEQFMKAFFERLNKKREKNKNVSQKEVFDSLNEEFCRRYGQPRYSDYHSFIVCKSKFLKNKKGNKI